MYNCTTFSFKSQEMFHIGQVLTICALWKIRFSVCCSLVCYIHLYVKNSKWPQQDKMYQCPLMTDVLVSVVMDLHLVENVPVIASQGQFLACNTADRWIKTSHQCIHIYSISESQWHKNTCHFLTWRICFIVCLLVLICILLGTC